MDNCMDCKNELNLCKLCVKKASIKWVISDCISTDSACVSVNLDAKKLNAESINTNFLCAQSGTINNLCATNLTVSNLNYCVKYRASVTLSAPLAYTLGTNIEWDKVVDDPNGNVSFGPFKYVVPVAGYYTLDYHLNNTLISGATLIGGTPVGLLTILVNGAPYVTDQVVYLSFSGNQTSNMGGVLVLNAGDVVQMNYQIIVLDASVGLIPYVGTTSLQGNGALAGQSYFTIHYRSSLNCSTIACSPCPSVSVVCPPDMDGVSNMNVSPRTVRGARSATTNCGSCPQ